MFKKKKQDGIDLDALKGIAESSPSIEWVNSLLWYMHKDSVSHFTLRKSDGIPSIPLQDELPEGELNFDQIINRLKVISGLDPIKYTGIKEGHHKLFIHGESFTASMIFDDSVDDPTCQIRMSIDL